MKKFKNIRGGELEKRWIENIPRSENSEMTRRQRYVLEELNSAAAAVIGVIRSGCSEDSVTLSLNTFRYKLSEIAEP